MFEYLWEVEAKFIGGENSWNWVEVNFLGEIWGGRKNTEPEDALDFMCFTFIASWRVNQDFILLNASCNQLFVIKGIEFTELQKWDLVR